MHNLPFQPCVFHPKGHPCLSYRTEGRVTASFKTFITFVCHLNRRATTQGSRQARPTELTTKTFSAQAAGKEKLSVRVVDLTASRGLVDRHMVLLQQNARQVRDRSGRPDTLFPDFWVYLREAYILCLAPP